jgi:uncharacterized protein (DUF849 family)
MEKLIISCALTGGATMRVQTPYVPYRPDEIIEQAVRAADAGAASMHIHARDPLSGKPTMDVSVFRQIAAGIKARSNVIVCPTTAGGQGTPVEERIKVIPALKPELASFNMGSINFAFYPIAERYKDEDFKFDWEKEYMLSTKNFIFRNTFGDMETLARVMEENGTRPEHEIYEIGHLYNLAFLIRRGIIRTPVWIQFVAGVLGGIGNHCEDLLDLKRAADRLIGRENYQWSVIGAGFPASFSLGTIGMAMGGNVRVGLEDNIFIEKGVLARSNAELVEKIVRIARELGKTPATPDEARQMLGLKGIDKVSY